MSALRRRCLLNLNELIDFVKFFQCVSGSQHLRLVVSSEVALAPLDARRMLLSIIEFTVDHLVPHVVILHHGVHATAINRRERVFRLAQSEGTYTGSLCARPLDQLQEILVLVVSRPLNVIWGLGQSVCSVHCVMH